MLRDFRITDFNNYQAIIGHQAVSADPDDTEQMDMRTLVGKPTSTARAPNCTGASRWWRPSSLWR